MTFEEFCEKELAPIRILEVASPYTLSLMRKSYESGQADIINKLKNCGYEIYLHTDSHGRKIYPLYGSWLENNGKLELLKRYGKENEENDKCK